MDEKNFFSDMASDGKEYVDLRIEEAKLQIADGLSVSIARVISMLLVVAVFIVTLTLLSFALVLLLGKLVGDYAIGALIVAGFFVIVSVVLYCLRKRLFKNQFSRLFASMSYDDLQKSRVKTGNAIALKERDIRVRVENARNDVHSFMSGASSALGFLKQIRQKISERRSER